MAALDERFDGALSTFSEARMIFQPARRRDVPVLTRGRIALDRAGRHDRLPGWEDGCHDPAARPVAAGAGGRGR